MDRAVPKSSKDVAFLSPKQFCERTGLSSATVYRYLLSGKIPFLQPAGPRGRKLIPIAALPESSIYAEQSRSTNETAEPIRPVKKGVADRISGPAPKWFKKINDNGI